MADELIDILDEQGNIIGQKMKSEAHKNGSWHQAAHIWIFNSKGEILLQKRAKSQEDYPGLWDVSAAGHLDLGEKPDKAAVRELFEELGVKVDISQLKKIEVRKIMIYEPKINFYNNEFVHVYLWKFNRDIREFKLQDEEVECIKFIPLDRFESDLKDPEKAKQYVPHGQYFFDVIDTIRKELKR